MSGYPASRNELLSLKDTWDVLLSTLPEEAITPELRESHWIAFMSGAHFMYAKLAKGKEPLVLLCTTYEEEFRYFWEYLSGKEGADN